MVRERFFEHTSPDGGTLLSRIKRTTYLRGNLKRFDRRFDELAVGAPKPGADHASAATYVNAFGQRRR